VTIRQLSFVAVTTPGNTWRALPPTAISLVTGIGAWPVIIQSARVATPAPTTGRDERETSLWVGTVYKKHRV